MSDTISVNVIAESDPISITITEPSKLSVNFYPVMAPHPRALEAALEAEASASNALASASEAQDTFEDLQVYVEQVVADLAATTSADSIINALIFG